MINWEQNLEQTVKNLSRLIKVESINPPGNEMPAIQVVKEILDAEGFKSDTYQILEPAPGRGNLVARLKGDGSERPILLTGHVDVVPVEREYWTRDPFSGEVIDGYIWGRGTVDMKGFLAMFLQVFIMAKKQNLPLKRDIILAAIADEEAGFDYGSRYLVDRHRELIEAEYAFNEIGGNTFYMNGLPVYPIQVAEKGVAWMRMTAKGEPGHASMPHGDNAVLHLAKALDRLRLKGRLPIHITPTVHEMLTILSEHLPFPNGKIIGQLRNPRLASQVLNFLPDEARRLFNAMLTNTVSPTILSAGTKTNVIPSEAQADIDCRTLPGQSPVDAMAEILKVTGKGITLETLYTSSGAEFPSDTPLYRLMTKALKNMDPNAIVSPMLMPGASDAAEYQRAGIIVYGFTPGIVPEDFPLIKMAHGHDERLPISYLRSGLPALWEVVSEFCT
jgi:acetylornithine deacetylase/succinyl-diaminopimelate desuccinylase-like protein